MSKPLPKKGEVFVCAVCFCLLLLVFCCVLLCVLCARCVFGPWFWYSYIAGQLVGLCLLVAHLLCVRTYVLAHTTGQQFVTWSLFS